jgi:hypothetical protein
MKEEEGEATQAAYGGIVIINDRPTTGVVQYSGAG